MEFKFVAEAQLDCVVICLNWHILIKTRASPTASVIIHDLNSVQLKQFY